MSNPYNNEIIFNGQTLMSLKEDTVTPDKVLAGETFHDRSGAPQTGNLITHNVYNGLDSASTNDALSANQGRVLNEKYNLLDDKFTWKFIGSVTGANNAINIPSDFNELMLVARIDGGGNAQSVVIPKAEFSRTSSWWRSGGYTSLNTPVLVTFFTNMSQAAFIHASLGSTDYSTTTVLYAYYR